MLHLTSMLIYAPLAEGVFRRVPSSGCGAQKITALWTSLLSLYTSFHASVHLKVNIHSRQHSLRGRGGRGRNESTSQWGGGGGRPSSSICSTEDRSQVDTEEQRPWSSDVWSEDWKDEWGGMGGHFLHTFFLSFQICNMSVRPCKTLLIRTSAELLSCQRFKAACTGQRPDLENLSASCKSAAPLLL